MSEVFRNVETKGICSGEGLALAARGFAVEGEAFVTMVILQQPAESFAPDFKAPVTFATSRSGGLGQRCDQDEKAFPSLNDV